MPRVCMCVSGGSNRRQNDPKEPTSGTSPCAGRKKERQNMRRPGKRAKGTDIFIPRTRVLWRLRDYLVPWRPALPFFFGFLHSLFLPLSFLPSVRSCFIFLFVLPSLLPFVLASPPYFRPFHPELFLPILLFYFLSFTSCFLSSLPFFLTFLFILNLVCFSFLIHNLISLSLRFCLQLFVIRFLLPFIPFFL